jgi:hypothetical protein
MNRRPSWWGIVLLLPALTGGCGSSGKHPLDASDGAIRPDGTSIDAPPVTDDAGADGLVDATSEPAPDAATFETADSDAARDATSDAGDGNTATVSRSPSCRRSWLYDWSTPQSVIGWSAMRGAPEVDATADELRLPFDSAELNTYVSSSQFVLEFDLALDGDLTFLVREQGDINDIVPSITRSGGELVLASVTSGAMSAAPGGGFTGQRFPAERVHVTLFVEPYQHLIGMKVDSSRGSFWSGFSNVSTVPQSLVFVGAGLTSEKGTTARAHVGAISGCERGFQDRCLSLNQHGFCAVDGVDTPPL